eukprot:Plantae.Rhodophyta-Palmaria_palmata.ctg6813.p1 GENE.Plantae.Rhodophyta-Palmaria_palmata.ctg6813~~Plantae.Rhodophyta-Palmaria_palmata.ctg6813.p1  ORF type:complete len:134 (+),score=8.65 Plantae.Rhodophyta-Palmaria_palmata.ctg6813:422-823(+)
MSRVIDSNSVARIKVVTGLAHRWRRALPINARRQQYLWRRMIARASLLPVADYGLLLAEAALTLRTEMAKFDAACVSFVCGFRPKAGQEDRALAGLRLEPLEFRRCRLAASVDHDVEARVLSLREFCSKTYLE